MNCHATRAVLDLHTEGRLTPRRANAVTEHLASCAECRKQVLLPAAPVKALAGDFKARLAAAMKAERTVPKPEPKLELALWPKDFSGVALTAAALVLIAVVIGWSGVPSQRDLSGDDLELAAGRMP